MSIDSDSPRRIASTRWLGALASGSGSGIGNRGPGTLTFGGFGGAKDFPLPNGLAFSPDESALYVDDSGQKHIRAFDVLPDGKLTHSRILVDMASEDPGVPDGLKVDLQGNVFCTGPGGVWILDPAGKHLGTISTGAKFHTNLAWGGGDWRTLFITTHGTLSRIRLNIPGVPVPRAAWQK